MNEFDRIINRHGTNCEKWDYAKKYLGSDDLLPMWVADTDFETPKFIIEALKERLEHPILGYTEPSDSFFNAAIEWEKRRHGWQTKKEWYIFTPGVVTGLNLAIEAFSEKKEGVILQSPVYFPFFKAIRNNGRKLLENRLVLKNGRYEIDFDDLEKKAKEAKVLLLCNPQNPTGRVFTKEELLRIGKIAIRHDLVIVSDEIHCDLVFRPNRHIPIASLSDEIASRTITLIAPSKTFNVAGLNTSLAILSNEELRKVFNAACERMHTGVPNIFGMIALESAFKNGDEWLEGLMMYLKKSADHVDAFLKKELPDIELIYPESTFLLWLDFKKTGMNPKELKEFLIFKAKLGFNDGKIFGTNGAGFARMNIGAPLSVVEEALKRLKEGFSNGS